MASVDLVFAAAPLTNGDLIFGDDGSNPAADAVISGTIALVRPMLTGAVALGAVVAGAITLHRPVLAGEVIYVSDTARPLVGHVSMRWQDANGMRERIELGWQDGAPMPLAVESGYQAARALEAGAREGWSDGLRDIAGQHRVRFEDGTPVQRAGIERFQDAVRGVAGEHLVRFEAGISIERGSAERFQDATRWMAGQHRSKYQDARPAATGWFSHIGSGRQIERGWLGRYQDAWQPRPGISGDPVVPPVDPCYVPSGDLVFETRWSADANLIFICERHGGDPEPGTVVVPIRRVYMVLNYATLRRVDGNIHIPMLGASMSLDVDTWTWGFQAEVPLAAQSALEPGFYGDPVEVELTVNGVPYRMLVEPVTRGRSFAQGSISLVGTGKAAILDEPYVTGMSFRNDGARTAEQLMGDVLTLNGVGFGWDVEFGLNDWLVPGGAFTHQGSYISALSAIASAAGGYLQPTNTASTIRVLPRYPSLPRDWVDLVPDFELPVSVTTREDIEWSRKPLYNRIYVSGTGGQSRVTVAGTAGDLLAPQVFDPLLSHPDARRQRAIRELGEGGRRAAVSLRLPVLPETGIITPGKFVRYVDEGVTRVGIVRRTGVDIRMPETWQTIGVETHVLAG